MKIQNYFFTHLVRLNFMRFYFQTLPTKSRNCKWQVNRIKGLWKVFCHSLGTWVNKSFKQKQERNLEAWLVLTNLYALPHILGSNTSTCLNELSLLLLPPDFSHHPSTHRHYQKDPSLQHVSKALLVSACFSWKRQNWVELRGQLGKGFSLSRLFGLEAFFSFKLIWLRTTVSNAFCVNFPCAMSSVFFFFSNYYSIPLILFSVDYYTLNEFYNSLTSLWSLKNTCSK